MLHYEYFTDFVFHGFVVNYNRVGMGLLAMSLVFSVWSAVLYFYRFAVAAAEHDLAT